MYGLKKHTSVEFLIGRELIQVAVGRFQVILNFDENTSISIEGSFEHFAKGTRNRAKNLPEAAMPLLGLIGKTVSGVMGEEAGTLKVSFSDGQSLSLHDSNPDSESYQINSPSGSIIV